MKLYKISQGVNNGYDTYDSAVVAAIDEEAARNTPPSGYADGGSWALPEKIEVEYIGEAKEGTEAGVIVASFNAG